MAGAEKNFVNCLSDWDWTTCPEELARPNSLYYYTADRLKPLITQVRALVDSKGGNWKPEILAGVRYSLANALVVEGLWSDENEPLLESVELLSQGLRKMDPHALGA
jgi:hypothetical protein